MATAVGVTLGAQAPARAPAAEIARAVQQRYDTVRDFTASFVHTYEGGVLRKTVSERGTVQIKKPGRMRWELHPTPRRRPSWRTDCRFTPTSPPIGR